METKTFFKLKGERVWRINQKWCRVCGFAWGPTTIFFPVWPISFTCRGTWISLLSLQQLQYLPHGCSEKIAIRCLTREFFLVSDQCFISVAKRTMLYFGLHSSLQSFSCGHCYRALSLPTTRTEVESNRAHTQPHRPVKMFSKREKYRGTHLLAQWKNV